VVFVWEEYTFEVVNYLIKMFFKRKILFMNEKEATKIINLSKIEDPRGNLSFIEEENHIPFKIKRVYWIYDVLMGSGAKWTCF